MLDDTRSRSDPLLRRLRRLTGGERREEAIAFVRRFYRENDLPDDDAAVREREVRQSLRRTGTYTHTRDELAFGARLAWRNHARCIGRLYWKTLDVIDCRHMTEPDEMAGQLDWHLDAAFNGGKIRSLISVFAPYRPGGANVVVESPQVLQYAGYVQADGRVVGDAKNVELTRTIVSLGWQSPETPGMFDLLPIILRESGGRRRLYEIPRDIVPEVTLSHPAFPGFEALQLRWYAVPIVSNMILTIGGVDYPCAPFNGFYMSTEISARNLSDEHRYDLLADVAGAIGIDTGTEPDKLWMDRALVELNTAILHSFTRDGVTMVDHHTASEHYMEFTRREEAAGRQPSGNWMWIVPPLSGSACRVFHATMKDLHLVPNYYYSRFTDAARLTANFDEEEKTRLWRRWRNARRRVNRWRKAWD